MTAELGRVPRPKIIVAAYSASPAHDIWNPEREQSYFEALAQLEQLAGFELPWLGALHPYDSDWLLRHLPRNFSFVFTDIGHVEQQIRRQPDYGLASRSAAGRAQAIADARQLSDDIRRLNDSLGYHAVDSVQLHSGAAGPWLDSAGFLDSLGALNDLDWSGAQLLVEHCDAVVAGQPAAKGFLSLDDEIRSVAAAGGVGIALNWGRSVIELRDADRFGEHLRLTREANLLTAVTFSGCADTAGTFGPAWADHHLPFTRSDAFPRGDQHSLLGVERVRNIVAESGDLRWLGVKFGWRGVDPDLSCRIAMLADSVAVVAEAVDSSR